MVLFVLFGFDMFLTFAIAVRKFLTNRAILSYGWFEVTIVLTTKNASSNVVIAV